ncbi:hypothetical protein AMTRI_Chr11g157700 [Amborella trichopoda]
MQIGVSGFDLESLGWRRGSEGLSKDDEEEVPTHLNTMNSCSFLGVSTDKLSIQYTGEALHGHDVGAVQSNCPAPTKRLVYYFEIFVRDAGQKGSISIGFTNERFKMRRQPGKNGGFLGSVCKDVKGPLFPTIGVHSPREKVDVNFGQRRFVFDIEAFAAEERMKQQMAIEKVSLPLSISHWIVRSYLLHYGYQDTLTSFDIASKGTFPSSPIEHQNNGTIEVEEMYALSHRKLLRQLIRSGNVDLAFVKLQEWYPQLVQDNTSTVRFLLHCQKFIELVRVGLLEEAVTYARAELARFFAMKPYEDLLQDCIALLAYEEPSKSSVGYLLDVAQREVAADAVNAMILSTNPNSKDSKNCLHSCLERLLRQLTACCLERRALNGDQGEVFNLHRVLLGEGSK